MTDQSTVTSPWASVTSWLTPTPSPSPSALFLFLNLVIGTLVVISRFSTHKKSHQLDSHDSPGGQQHQLARAPSLLDRVKSINFSLYKFPNHHEHDPFNQPIEPTYPIEPEEQQPPRLDRAPSLLERVKSIRLVSVYRSQVMEDTEGTETNTVDHKPKRSKSETKKSKMKAKENNMKKSASERSMRGETTTDEETEMVERRRPQTARLERNLTVGDGDHAVDAKADDFINKFKRQLRLQRLDSLLRYKEMLQGK